MARRGSRLHRILWFVNVNSLLRRRGPSKREQELNILLKEQRALKNMGIDVEEHYAQQKAEQEQHKESKEFFRGIVYVVIVVLIIWFLSLIFGL